MKVVEPGKTMSSIIINVSDGSFLLFKNSILIVFGSPICFEGIGIVYENDATESLKLFVAIVSNSVPKPFDLTEVLNWCTSPEIGCVFEIVNVAAVCKFAVVPCEADEKNSTLVGIVSLSVNL